MTTGIKDQALTNIGPRISEPTRSALCRLWRSANQGAEWILNGFPNLYERTLAEMREGYFTKAELALLLDAADLLVFFPEMAGQMLLFNLQDKMAIPTLKTAHDTVDYEALEEKVRKLRHYQRAMLEIWAHGFRQQEASVSRGEYIDMLL